MSELAIFLYLPPADMIDLEINLERLPRGVFDLIIPCLPYLFTRINTHLEEFRNEN